MENIKKITVNASSKYDIIIGKGILDDAGKYISQIEKDIKIAIITDDIVDKLYSNRLIDSLLKSGYSPIKYVIKNGEKSKNINSYFDILRFLAQNNVTRKDLIIAFGGGVVGDLAGFCASTYLRGIKYIQIPTTLLAQIDSSVGGKTAIDIPEGKNLVGAFCQPEIVLCDIDLLKSLPNEIYLDGMGEGAKYAILDKKIFELVKNDFDLLEFVYLCIEYKKNIVENDEFESGNRKLLNLGHTISHAIEKLSQFNISHGKAVAFGLKIIAKISLNHDYIKEDEYQDIMGMIEKLTDKSISPYNMNEIIQNTLVDKKRMGDKITLVMIKGIGECCLEQIDINCLAEFLDENIH